MASPRGAGPTVAVLFVIASVLTAGCDTGDGRTLRPPAPGATAPALPASTTATTAAAVIGPPVGSEESGALVLASPAIFEAQAIPSRYACDGENVSPPLSWSGVPAGTVELAITVRDPDAPDGDFVHWVVTGLDPLLAGIGEGALPEGAVEARNDTSEFGWFGPCPPEGSTHRYVFTLYALSVPSGVAAGADAIAAIAALEEAPAATAVLTATYGRASS